MMSTPVSGSSFHLLARVSLLRLVSTFLSCLLVGFMKVGSSLTVSLCRLAGSWILLLLTISEASLVRWATHRSLVRTSS